MSHNQGKYAGCQMEFKDNVNFESQECSNQMNQGTGGLGLPLPPQPRRRRNSVGSGSQATGQNPMPGPTNPNTIALTANELAALKAKEFLQQLIDAANKSNESSQSSDSNHPIASQSSQSNESTNHATVDLSDFKDGGLLQNQEFSANVLKDPHYSKQVLSHLTNDLSLLTGDQMWLRYMASRPNELNQHVRQGSGGSLGGSLPAASEYPINPNVASIENEMQRRLQYGGYHGSNHYFNTLRKATNGVETGTVQGSLLSALVKQHKDNVQREKDSNEKHLKK